MTRLRTWFASWNPAPDWGWSLLMWLSVVFWAGVVAWAVMS